MKKFSAGAMRLTIHDARLASANDLVRRTLAQHGLAPGGSISAPMPNLSPRKSPAAPAALIAPGASFEQARFTCDAGSRSYMTYVPASAKDGAAGLLMMLHGCTQTALDFAAGTKMNAVADQHGFVVVYPEQSRGDNAQSCWNWFSRGDQQRGRGEPAILAGLAAQTARKFGVTPETTFVAGLSAGAAMAVILGETYNDVFTAVGAHSGLPYGAATDVPSAFAAMSGNAKDRRASAKHAPRTIVFHGTEDHTVNLTNAVAIADDIVRAGPAQTLSESRTGRKNGRTFTCEITETVEGRLLIEHWKIDGLGHAWSGGGPDGSYTDATGPDASAEMVRFFLKHR
ncbi:extracellular catalytic domain type 1 short-chain-length polyhydroxyalkanoate depolymerase [Falsirhodobacter xinxiangensis]|uniref:extracellular catalytic domain type 1 short-chain-length polyhydroxyalkanoate depolymerase n=1 Tax=Falsirhodobacter xinxiangensis TaxID=2530049 RepID=UPI0010A9E877|nr:PHB depolymerase family esterase [Rhodobacter xinxiangensis]